MCVKEETSISFSAFVFSVFADIMVSDIAA